MNIKNDQPMQVVKISDVAKMTTLKRATIYRRLNSDPTFPRPIKLSDSNSRGAPIGFIKHEIEAWIKSRIELRDS